MKNLMPKLCWVICSALVLTNCGKSGPAHTSVTSSSSSSSGAAFVYLGSVQKNRSIASSNTGITYPYHVYLPYNYAVSAKTYPIIYGTDAQWTFDHFSQTLDQRNKDVIFVGIEEGALNSNRRFTDFLGPGTSAYINFFKTEFAPMIEKTFRGNGERTYVGTSLGGLLGATLLTQEPVGAPYFKNYMLFDGSFFAFEAADIEKEIARFNASKQLNITLILTSANNPGNEHVVNEFQNRYAAREYEHFKIYRRSYSLHHNDVGNPSFDDSIDWLY